MEVVSFTHDPALAAACVALRFRVHRGEPLWIPPFRHHLARYYDPAFPLLARPGNACRHFACIDGGLVRAHVSAIVNGDIRARHGADIGLLGVFACDSAPPALAVLEAATDWLRRQHRAFRIWGPVNFDIWHEMRFKTGGFDLPPFFGEPANPPTDPLVFQDSGFTLLQTWQSLEASTDMVRRIMAPHAEAEAAVRAAGYRFDRIHPDREQDVVDMHCVEAAALEGAVAYTPPPLEEYRRLFAGYTRLADSGLVTLLRAPEGHAAGLAVLYPDPAAAVRAMRGGSGPLARLRFLLHRGDTTRAVFYFLGTMPEERHRQRGLGKALLHHGLRRALSSGCASVVFALLAADSPARALVGPDMAAAQSSYALFERRR